MPSGPVVSQSKKRRLECRLQSTAAVLSQGGGVRGGPHPLSSPPGRRKVLGTQRRGDTGPALRIYKMLSGFWVMLSFPVSPGLPGYAQSGRFASVIDVFGGKAQSGPSVCRSPPHGRSRLLSSLGLWASGGVGPAAQRASDARWLVRVCCLFSLQFS